MDYKIYEDEYEKVEIREIGIGEYFEENEKVYQRLGVGSNFIAAVKPIDNKDTYKVYVLDLQENIIYYLTDSSKVKVKRLYLKSPILLSRAEP